MRSTTPPPTCTTWRHQASWRVPSAEGLYWAYPGWPLTSTGVRRESRALRRLGREPEPAGLLRPLQPERKGRHGEGGVLVEQRHQGLDVVAEEGVLVAVEQGPVLGVERRQVGRGHDVVAAERGPGPLQRAVDRRHVVSSSSATSVASKRRTSRRTSTARWRGGRCWRAATKASRTDSRTAARSAGSAAGGHHPGVGHRQHPRRLGQRGADALVEAVGRAEVDRAGPGASGPRGGRSRRWWRCGRATSAGWSGPRSGRGPSTPGSAPPARRRRPRTASRASGSSRR